MKRSPLKKTVQNISLLMLLIGALVVVVTHEGRSGFVLADDSQEGQQKVSLSVEQVENTFGDLTNQEHRAALDTLAQEEGGIIEQLGDRYLVIPKNEKQAGEAVLTEEYVYRTIKLTVHNVTHYSWSEDMVLRYHDGVMDKGVPETGELDIYMEEYLNLADEEPIEGDLEENAGNGAGEDLEENQGEEDEPGGDIIRAVKVSYDALSETAEVSITLDHLYVPFLQEKEEFYYITLKRPREVYERILVVDAGHGGKHPGTMSSDKTCQEKDVNLSIVLALQKLLDNREDIKVYYTRQADESVYLRPRVDLANEAEADFFISVHNNAYWNQSAYGTEVLYNELLPETEGHILSSQELAVLCLEEVTKLLGTRNRGLRTGSGTYIIGYSKVPVALIEVGYLTNWDDLAMLRKEENIALAAQGIYHAVLCAYGLEERKSDEIGENSFCYQQ